MLTLFPKFKTRLILLSAVLLGCIGLLIVLRPGANLIAFAVLSVLCIAIVGVSQYMNAANAHAKQLNKLYNQLDVEGFLREYEPHLNAKLRNQNLELMVRIHLSNAYAAQGRFEDTMKLLSAVTVKEGKKLEDTLLSRFAVTSNLCYCAEQMGDVETAKKYLDRLLELRGQLEEIQKAKPEKRRMVFSTDLNEQCYKFLTTGKADVELLKTQVQKNNTQQLHRITTSLWIARADLAEQNRREAESILNQIVKLAPNLYPGKAAAELLAGLPAKAEA